MNRLHSASPSAAAPAPPPAEKREKINILLVDDQPGKLTAHEAILTELGENVVKATSGRQALECLLREDFAVILLDVRMPEMDGFETAELIRRRPRFEKTPIIFITGYNTNDIDRLKGYRLGAVDYLFLPIISEVLKAKVGVFVELARQTQVIKHQAEYLAHHNREQARQLETILKLNTDLREANHELEAFSYTVSHDLRAPLRSLQGYTNVLLEDYGPKLDSTAQSHLQKLHRAALHMDRLTRDLLDYSRIAREQIRLEPLCIQTVLKDVTIPNRAAQLTLAPELLPVLAQPTLLTQCLGNLLDNAAKFVAPGVCPQIRLRTERRGDFVRVWVEDNGIGIDPAFHKKVFGIFERVGNVSRFDGTGIGLAIVARAVQRMGGQCGVESAAGSGSRFWIELRAINSARTTTEQKEFSHESNRP
jgi:two-component system, sensor histidine kinase and response regulator